MEPSAWVAVHTAGVAVHTAGAAVHTACAASAHCWDDSTHCWDGSALCWGASAHCWDDSAHCWDGKAHRSFFDILRQKALAALCGIMLRPCDCDNYYMLLSLCLYMSCFIVTVYIIVHYYH